MSSPPSVNQANTQRPPADSSTNTRDYGTYMMIGAIVLMLLIFILYAPFLVIVSVAVIAGLIYANRSKTNITAKSPPP